MFNIEVVVGSFSVLECIILKSLPVILPYSCMLIDFLNDSYALGSEAELVSWVFFFL